MSSSYEFVCMSHDPAMPTGRDYSIGEVSGDLLLVSMAQVREGHPRCELVIARTSGAVVEMGCVSDGHGHARPHWTDMDVIRLVLHARPAAADRPALARALERLFDARQCWPDERIRRLESIVDLGESDG